MLLSVTNRDGMTVTTRLGATEPAMESDCEDRLQDRLEYRTTEKEAHKTC